MHFQNFPTRKVVQNLFHTWKKSFCWLIALDWRIYCRCREKKLLQGVYGTRHKLQGSSPAYTELVKNCKDPNAGQFIHKIYLIWRGTPRWQSRRPRCKAAAHVPKFDTLVPAPELSFADAKSNPLRKMHDTFNRERQLWSGNESVKNRYVSGSFVAGTSASSPGAPRHLSNV